MRNQLEQPLSDFELKKRKYFSNFALHYKSKLAMHRRYGVLAKSEGWRNVSEHCLLEAVESDVLAEVLKLSEEDRSKLVIAALLHDFYKKKEIEALKKEGLEGQRKSEEERSRILADAGFDDAIIRIIKSATYVPRMLDKDVTELEKIMQYVDDITMGSSIGSVDERVDKVEADPRYREENESGQEIFGDKTFSQAQRYFGHQIEAELTKKIGLDNPRDLPKFIEEEIRKRIE